MSAIASRWKDIPGWEGFYQVNPLGQVRSLDREIVAIHPQTKQKGFRKYKGKLLKTTVGKNGYSTVVFIRGARKDYFLVHRLVLLAFAGPCPESLEVLHGNGIRNDNRLENLRYGTRSENAFDALKHGKKVFRGLEHGHCKFTRGTLAKAKKLKGQMSSRKAAARFGVHHSVMLNLWAGKSYVE
jgi:hypothetical protein